MRISILIDSENVLPSFADAIFEQAKEMGDIAHKEIYGTAAALNSWVAPVLKYAIHPNLTIRAAKGKNSSDIALVIGAMDLLALAESDAFIIASSDSDFSSLSVRLRNAGKEVIGMGTEKSNDLWQTACSRFIVLQNAPARQSAPVRQSPPAPRQSAQSKAASAPAKAAPAPVKAAPSHDERVGVIRQFIMKRLKSNKGRLQTSTLFPSLNRMAEYRADRQDVGMKPLNYLTHVFNGEFVFTDTPDGNNWISLPGTAPVPAPSEAEASAAVEVEAAPTDAPVEATVEAPEAVEPEAFDAEDAAAETPAVEDAQDSGDAPESDPRAGLIAGGIPEDAVDQVVAIFQQSGNPRSAYNKLRSAFGNTTGREYYNVVKKLAEQG